MANIEYSLCIRNNVKQVFVSLVLMTTYEKGTIIISLVLLMGTLRHGALGYISQGHQPENNGTAVQM